MSEILLVLVAALMLFGAKRLPEIARSLGKAMEEFRRAARDVTDEIMHVTVDDDSSKHPKPDYLLPSPDEPDETVAYVPPDHRDEAEEDEEPEESERREN